SSTTHDQMTSPSLCIFHKSAIDGWLSGQFRTIAKIELSRHGLYFKEPKHLILAGGHDDPVGRIDVEAFDSSLERSKLLGGRFLRLAIRFLLDGGELERGTVHRAVPLARAAEDVHVTFLRTRHEERTAGSAEAQPMRMMEIGVTQHRGQCPV